MFIFPDSRSNFWKLSVGNPELAAPSNQKSTETGWGAALAQMELIIASYLSSSSRMPSEHLQIASWTKARKIYVRVQRFPWSNLRFAGVLMALCWRHVYFRHVFVPPGKQRLSTTKSIVCHRYLAPCPSPGLWGPNVMDDKCLDSQKCILWFVEDLQIMPSAVSHVLCECYQMCCWVWHVYA